MSAYYLQLPVQWTHGEFDLLAQAAEFIHFMRSEQIKHHVLFWKVDPLTH